VQALPLEARKTSDPFSPSKDSPEFTYFLARSPSGGDAIVSGPKPFFLALFPTKVSRLGSDLFLARDFFFFHIAQHQQALPSAQPFSQAQATFSRSNDLFYTPPLDFPPRWKITGRALQQVRSLRPPFPYPHKKGMVFPLPVPLHRAGVLFARFTAIPPPFLQRTSIYFFPWTCPSSF